MGVLLATLEGLSSSRFVSFFSGRQEFIGREEIRDFSAEGYEFCCDHPS
jgi:hypothetical protein